MKKQLIMSIAFLGIFMMCLSTDYVYASANAESVVQEYVKAMEAHDWNRFTNIHCTEESESLRHFFQIQ